MYSDIVDFAQTAMHFMQHGLDCILYNAVSVYDRDFFHITTFRAGL